MAVTANLLFNLAAWRKGAKQAADSTVSAFRGVGSRIGGMISTAFGAVGLGGLLSAGGVLAGITAGLTKGYAAANDYADSLEKVRNALRLEGAGSALDAQSKRVEALGRQVREALGIGRTEFNTAFADLVTRGFDTRQAEQLAVLAANVARKTGTPLADVAKKIADAANGGVDALKDLGIQLTATGNRVVDAEAAVAALKVAYGDIGVVLTNPLDRLRGAFGEFFMGLGAQVAPMFDGLINGVTDFANGLLNTQEGYALLVRIADTLRGIGNAFVGLGVGVANVFDAVVAGARSIGPFLMTFVSGLFTAIAEGFARLVDMLAEMLVEKLKSMPGVTQALEFAGFDLDSVGSATDGLVQELNATKKVLSGELDAIAKPFQDSLGTLFRGELGKSASAVAQSFGDVAAAGARRRQEQVEALQRRSDATRGETFAGQPAQEAERRRAEAAAQKQAEQEAAAREKFAQRFQREGRGGGGNVTVQIVNPRGQDVAKRRAVPRVRR